MTFWDHLDELRGVIVRSAVVVLLASIVAFIFKDALFDIVLAPRGDTFVTYRWLSTLSALAGQAPELDRFSVELINTGLAGQFMIHVKTAFCAGILVASPYILYCLFAFISPGLYENERRAALAAMIPGYVMFMLGVAVSYFLVFPLTFRFLGTYTVASDVTNLISLDSYMSTLIVLCLSMGIVFELPVIAVLLARLGILGSAPMRHFRRHAIVVILIAAAIITPTSDIFTLLIVSLPIWLLYEISILLVATIVRHTPPSDPAPGTRP